MKDKKEAIYFVAILPPEEIRKEISIFIKYAGGAFKSTHAQKAPPHITIFPSFKWDPDKEDILDDVIALVAENEVPFYIQLKNFDCFAPSVIYINVENNPQIFRIHKDLIGKLYNEFEIENKSPHKFMPHIPVAFRDLKRNFFMKAWSHFGRSNYERAFQADKLALLKHEDGKWDVVSEYLLGVD